MQREAEQLGLAGWVRNRRDGAVEAEATGASGAIDRLIAWARVGPPAARVDAVAVERTPVAECAGGRFEIR